ncbi:transcriptional regulator [Sinorhizobium meliloti]|uniref:transposase n=2 Tax=Rhizobium meliloti TaxID=382 RepID=UPI000FD58401|nr:transposase [Sinorhizobium meliloti]RVG22548.1 transcriptional regulator [Sinorhizobium meliloti]RVL45403.1 transcriptional regulator [Sinorhizobium meliloti]RVL65045.1 transcriptional regulator [Sinorhizobium meliloti]RVL76476.1 transcriptional regulator [Sinorhizobium meliloti]RVN36733.1 transcriptional regulator [Sinorhizobium meliloti]
MADESNTGPVAAAVAADAEVKVPTAKKLRSPRPQKAAAEPAQPKAPAAKPRRYSEQERNDKLKLIETQVSEGTLKNAIQSAGISEQTYYHWKGAAKISAQKDDKTTEPLPAGDELADLVELEEENQKLRKRLAEKLRGENAELRKRLGLD